MPIDQNELIALHPTLYHVTFASNRERVLQSGLRSASCLKSEYPSSERNKKTARANCCILPSGATLNDQIPMCGDVWNRCKLPLGMSHPCEWFAYLDNYVFFWTTEERLVGFLKVRKQRGYESVVFKISTKELMQKFLCSVELSSQNSGGPYAPNPKPRARFCCIQKFPFAELAKLRRNRKKAVVELVLKQPMDRPDLLTLMAPCEIPSFE